MHGVLKNGKEESFKYKREIKKEKEFKRKPLEERVGRENQTWHSNESSKRKPKQWNRTNTSNSFSSTLCRSRKQFEAICFKGHHVPGETNLERRQKIIKSFGCFVWIGHMTKSSIKDRKVESSNFSRARLFARSQKSDTWESNKGKDFISSQNDLQVNNLLWICKDPGNTYPSYKPFLNNLWGRKSRQPERPERHWS